MIVKILWKSKTFRAVRYNTRKVEQKKGELMKVSGFGALEGLSEIKPQDYINYLSSLAARNRRVVYPQFHAMISTKGRSLDKHELVALAENWLKGMGYGNQPYLLIFHKDTGNNHIHMVSSRVDREGNKISDSFEKIRAYRVLGKLIGTDEKKGVETALSQALLYNFSTHAQFLLILEKQGYTSRTLEEKYEISKFGELVGSIERTKIDKRISMQSPNQNRKLQLRQIFEKYREIEDATIYPVREKLPGGGMGKVLGYSSLLSDRLSSSFGIQLVFHFKDGKPPYGYTILDHSGKNVFKGGDIMSLSKFMQAVPEAQVFQAQFTDMVETTTSGRSCFAPSEEMLLAGPSSTDNNETFGGLTEHTNLVDISLGLDISDDIDDEQILGRNRRRQKKARTYTR